MEGSALRGRGPRLKTHIWFEPVDTIHGPGLRVNAAGGGGGYGMSYPVERSGRSFRAFCCPGGCLPRVYDDGHYLLQIKRAQDGVAQRVAELAMNGGGSSC